MGVSVRACEEMTSRIKQKRWESGFKKSISKAQRQQRTGPPKVVGG